MDGGSAAASSLYHRRALPAAVRSARDTALNTRYQREWRSRKHHPMSAADIEEAEWQRQRQEKRAKRETARKRKLEEDNDELEGKLQEERDERERTRFRQSLGWVEEDAKEAAAKPPTPNTAHKLKRLAAAEKKRDSAANKDRVSKRQKRVARETELLPSDDLPAAVASIAPPPYDGEDGALAKGKASGKATTGVSSVARPVPMAVEEVLASDYDAHGSSLEELEGGKDADMRGAETEPELPDYEE
jgi:hypothetical protein